MSNILMFQRPEVSPDLNKRLVQAANNTYQDLVSLLALVERLESNFEEISTLATTVDSEEARHLIEQANCSLRTAVRRAVGDVCARL